MTFTERFEFHFYHRSNWWMLSLLVWFTLHWKFGWGGDFALVPSGFPPLILLLSYFAISPAFFFALAGVDPFTSSRSWGYLVEATWPIYVLDHVINLFTLTGLYWLMGAPMGWGLFLPLTQTVYLTFYAARGCLRRIGYNKFDDERDDF